MQKKRPALHEVGSQRKPHGLRLNRETIRALDPVLVGLAQGGLTTVSTDSGCCETNESDIQQNCYPTTCSFGTRTTIGPQRTY
jgi:hypothetical protein